MNGVGGESGLRTDPQRKAQSGRLWGAGKTVRRKMNGVGGKRTADGSAEKGGKMRAVATQWAPEGNEWRIETHQAYGASRADTGRPDADAICRTHIFFLLMELFPGGAGRNSGSVLVVLGAFFG